MKKVQDNAKDMIRAEKLGKMLAVQTVLHNTPLPQTMQQRIREQTGLYDFGLEMTDENKAAMYAGAVHAATLILRHSDLYDNTPIQGLVEDLDKATKALVDQALGNKTPEED